MAPHVVGSFRFRISASQSWQITGGKATTLRRMMARCSRKREAAPHSGVGQCSMSRVKDRPSEDPDRAAPRFGLNRRQFSTMLASVAGLPLINGPDLISGEFLFSTPSGSYPLYDKAASHVLPKDGFQSRIALKDSHPQTGRIRRHRPRKVLCALRKEGTSPGRVCRGLERPVRSSNSPDGRQRNQLCRSALAGRACHPYGRQRRKVRYTALLSNMPQPRDGRSAAKRVASSILTSFRSSA